MRILFISANEWVPWGGSEELWSQTALSLLQQGIDIRISIANWDPLPDKIAVLQQHGADVRLRKPMPVPTVVERIKSKFAPAKESPQMEIFSGIDLVIINQGDILDGIHWMEYCQRANVPFRIIVQLVNELNFRTDIQLLSLLQFYKSAQCVYFVSENNHRLTERILGSAITNARLVQNPFRAVPAIPDYPSHHGGMHLAFVASLNSIHKGHDLLFESLAKQKWNQRPLHIHLYGKGPNEQALRRLAELYRLQNISFEGHCTAQQIWSANHALILCSRMEGQSLALLEAMYCNRMAVVTNVGDADKLVIDGKTGFLAASPTVDSIGAALERAWEQREHWASLGVEAAHRLQAVYSPDPIGDFANMLIDAN